MQLQKEKRYEAFIKKNRVCKNNNKVEFDYIFSLKVKEISDKKVVFYKINPIKTIDILKKEADFFLIDKKNCKKFIYILKIEDIYNDTIEAKIFSKEEIDERRFFDRFTLCAEDLGYFNLFVESKEICKKVFIEDISVIGIKINVPKVLDNISLKDLEIVKEHDHISIDIAIETVDIEKNRDHTIIRGKIKDSNMSIANIITKTYIDITKKIFNI